MKTSCAMCIGTIILISCLIAQAGEDASPASAGESSDPRVAYNQDPFLDTLDGWHWVITGEKTKVVEVPWSSRDMLDGFIRRFRDGAVKEHGEEIALEPPFTEAETTWILQGLCASLGARYTLIVPDTKQVLGGHITGAAYRPTGDGGYDGFSLQAALDDGIAMTAEQLKSRWVVGLMRNGGAPEHSPFDYGSSTLSPEQREQALKMLKDEEPDKKVVFTLDARVFHFDKAGSLAVLYTREVVGEIPRNLLVIPDRYNHKSLGCLRRVGGEWRKAPFTWGGELFDDGLALIEDPDNGIEVGMHDSTYAPLRDINENGYAEVCIVSTFCFLFEGTPDGDLQLRTRVYFGP